MSELILIAHNLRSTHNVGSLLRTADGLGVQEVILSGYTPYPALPADDLRLPHIRDKLTRQIHKTALGAEQTQAWRQADDVLAVITSLQQQGYVVAALEQAVTSVKLQHFTGQPQLALLVGREVEGVEAAVLAACDVIVEIPMQGAKESFNVSVAAAIGLWQLGQ